MFFIITNNITDMIYISNKFYTFVLENHNYTLRCYENYYLCLF